MSDKDAARPAPEKKKPNALVARVQRIVAWVLSTKPARAMLLYQEHNGSMLADSITYRALFSVFAGVFVGFAIAGIWLSGNPEVMNALVDALGTAIPGLVGNGGLIDPDDLVQPLSLSISGIIALVGLIGTAIGAITSTRTAIRTLADLPGDKTFFLWLILRDLLLALLFGGSLLVAVVATFLSTSALGLVFDWLGISKESWLYSGGSQTIGVIVIFAIDSAIVALMFRILSGLKPNARSLWSGALLGGAGLTVLQLLSSLFVGGARSNPLLASFGAIVALLIWFNFSAQVILIACSYIITGIDEQRDRVKERYGATSMADRAVKKAERRVADASADLQKARADAAKARGLPTPSSGEAP